MLIDRFLKYSFAVCGLVTGQILCGCSESDVTLPAPEEENQFIVETDITVSLGAAWEIDADATRATPPGYGENNNPSSGSNSSNIDPSDLDGLEEITGVDEVRIFTFRRKEGTNDSFTYDAMNDIVRPVEKTTKTGIDHTEPNESTSHSNHYVATAKLKKVAGFEYKVIAVAYESKRLSSFPTLNVRNSKFILPTLTGDAERLTFNVGDGVKYEEFKADIYTAEIGTSNQDWNELYHGTHVAIAWSSSLEKNCEKLSRKAIEVPQLFFGECKTVTGNEIIGFSEETGEFDKDGEAILNTNIDVTGVLYRGMAKVECRINIKPHYTTKVLHYDFQWITLMASDVRNRVNLKNYDGFLPTSSDKDATCGSDFTPVVYKNLDSNGQITLSAYFLPGKAKLAVRAKYNVLEDPHVINGGIKPVDSDEDHSGNGTGIVSPEVNDGYFYLRRNHKYIINISDSEILFKNHSFN